MPGGGLHPSMGDQTAWGQGDRLRSRRTILADTTIGACQAPIIIIIIAWSASSTI